MLVFLFCLLWGTGDGIAWNGGALAAFFLAACFFFVLSSFFLLPLFLLFPLFFLLLIEEG
jgi:hypothetical protein